MSDRAYAWMVEKLEMTEFESRDRLALLAFLDLVMSNPLRATQDMRDAGKITMREAFQGAYGSDGCRVP